MCGYLLHTPNERIFPFGHNDLLFPFGHNDLIHCILRWRNWLSRSAYSFTMLFDQLYDLDTERLWVRVPYGV